MTEATSPIRGASGARGYWWLGVTVVIVLADQFSKYLVKSYLAHGDQVSILPVFSWVRWHNDGAAFSMFSGSGGRWFFVALAVGFTIFIVYELRRLPVGDKLMGLIYALILGGALGNMVDRLFVGYVVDFILVHYRSWYFPAFNVADIALSVGAGLWIGSMFFAYLKERREAE